MAHCANCSNQLLFKYSFTSIKACNQCGHLVSITNNSPQYKPLPIPDEYCLEILDKKLKINNIDGVVTGRLRYFYDEGYMNKWAFCFNNKYFWLCESVGHYFVLMPSQAASFSKDLEAGDYLVYEDINYSIDATHSCIGYSLEGELPNFDHYLSAFWSIECSNQKQVFIIHQNTNNVQVAFTGMEINFSEISGILK